MTSVTPFGDRALLVEVGGAPEATVAAARALAAAFPDADVVAGSRVVLIDGAIPDARAVEAQLFRQNLATLGKRYMRDLREDALIEMK